MKQEKKPDLKKVRIYLNILKHALQNNKDDMWSGPVHDMTLTRKYLNIAQCIVNEIGQSVMCIVGMYNDEILIEISKEDDLSLFIEIAEQYCIETEQSLQRIDYQSALDCLKAIARLLDKRDLDIRVSIGRDKKIFIKIHKSLTMLLENTCKLAGLNIHWKKTIYLDKFCEELEAVEECIRAHNDDWRKFEFNVEESYSEEELLTKMSLAEFVMHEATIMHGDKLIFSFRERDE